MFWWTINLYKIYDMVTQLVLHRAGPTYDDGAQVLGQTVSQLIRNVIDRPPVLPYKDTLAKNNCC